MTLKSLIEADVASVFLNTDEFAETVTRLIGGDAGHTQLITAVVTLDQPTFERSRGRGYETRSTMMIDDASAIATGDAVLIRGVRYEVITVKPADFGSVDVTLSRYASEARGVKTAGDI